MKKPFGDERLDEHEKTDWCSQEKMAGAGRQSGGPQRAPRANTLAIRNLLFCAALLFSLESDARAQQRPVDLTTVSIEDLMQLQVTSASKKQERFFDTAAAIYVITQEDIRRSGATSIPELLRTVPGLDVAHIDASKWAISSRGFNDRFANKMLVLIDGRTVYSPLFSGVNWDVQDTLLEDIERIEVIRGPGATLWGANAVNGVINIITKAAKDTQGGLVTAGAGNQERGFGAVRYGGQAGHNGYYRFFAKYFNRDEFANPSGQDAADTWNILRGGFRTDWTLSGRDTLTVQGDFYNGSAGETVPEVLSLSPPITAAVNDRNHLAGGNLLSRWNRVLSPRSGISLQFYYDGTDRRDSRVGEVRHTVDFDFNHHLALGKRHDVVWGLGYRYTADSTVGSLSISFNPSRRRDNLFSSFVQDEIVLLPDRLRLTLGAKLEHNGYTGFEFQPNVRLLWTPHARHAIWAAFSHADRVPSRADTALRVNLAAFPGTGGVTTLISLLGNPQLEEEDVWASEVGYRAELSKRLSLDLAAFYNSYKNLRASEPGTPFFETSPAPPHLVLPQIFQSALRGETHGVEIAPSWHATNRWKLAGGYAWLRGNLHWIVPGAVMSSPPPDLNSPHHQWSLRSYVNLPRNFEFDTSLFYVGSLSGPGVPRYVRLDTRLGWRPAESLEISLVGQNLLDARHAEFGSAGEGVNATQVRRSVYAKFAWRLR